MHPNMFGKKVKTCKVFGCTNKSNEGTFVGEFCLPCYMYITRSEGTHSQAYRNALKEQKKDE